MHSCSIIIFAIFITHRQSLGQGNIFTGVCLSTGVVGFPACITGHMTGGSASRRSASSGVCIQVEGSVFGGSAS